MDNLGVSSTYVTTVFATPQLFHHFQPNSNKALPYVLQQPMSLRCALPNDKSASLLDHEATKSNIAFGPGRGSAGGPKLLWQILFSPLQSTMSSIFLLDALHENQGGNRGTP